MMYFDKRVRNIAVAIQEARRLDSPYLEIFEIAAMYWIYMPMVGKDMSADEIADYMDGWQR